MNIKFAMLATKATCGNTYILTADKPVYAYKDGKRDGDPIAYTYTVVLPKRKYEQLQVRIDGDCRLESPVEPVAVSLNELQLAIKWSQAGYYIAAQPPVLA